MFIDVNNKIKKNQHKKQTNRSFSTFDFKSINVSIYFVFEEINDMSFNKI
jgi:hypothetical protein